MGINENSFFLMANIQRSHKIWEKTEKIFFSLILFPLILCPSRKDIQSSIALSRINDIYDIYENGVYSIAVSQQK